MTSCKEAIRRFEEEKNGGNPASEAKIVWLCALLPFITKMDSNLDVLENCEKLSMSTNAIEKIIPLPKLK